MKDKKEVGGADRVRTDDLHNAIVALFQLSYGPENIILTESFYTRRDQMGSESLTGGRKSFLQGRTGKLKSLSFGFTFFKRKRRFAWFA